MNGILVVDDDEQVRKLLQSFVLKQGYKVICASTGKEALEKMEEGPALVLLDMMLPDMFGMKVLEKIVKKNASAGVIVVTGVAEHALGMESLEKGALDFITKPIDMEHLEFLIDFHILRALPAKAQGA